MNHSTFCEGIDLQTLQDHYEALIGDPKGLDRETLMNALRGTDFEEHEPMLKSTSK